MRNRKFVQINTQGSSFLRMAIRIIYTTHIIILINMAQNPKRIISSLRNGTRLMTSADPLA
jgi:hypothetical protein